jgi:hypothetical protein
MIDRELDELRAPRGRGAFGPGLGPDMDVFDFAKARPYGLLNPARGLHARGAGGPGRLCPTLVGKPGFQGNRNIRGAD